MALKFKHKTKDEIPADQQTFYVEQSDGSGWTLDVEDAVPKEKLEEFRGSNRALTTKVKELTEKFGDVDLDDYNSLKAIRKELEDKKLTGTKSEEILKQRTEEMQKAHTVALAKLQQDRDAIAQKLATVTISAAAVAEATKRGMAPGAADDIQMRVASVFRLNKDGLPTAYKSDGQERYGATGEPLTIGEFVDQLTKDAAHLFAPSEGAGGAGGGGRVTTNNGTTKNPWKQEHWNMTEQGQLVKSDPKGAARLATAAGKKVTWDV